VVNLNVLDAKWPEPRGRITGIFLIVDSLTVTFNVFEKRVKNISFFVINDT
jgi:hypothetical protein